MDEIWKQIKGHPNHYVSNLGRVKSIDHIVNDKAKNITINQKLAQ